MPIQLTINGRQVAAPDGATILEAARANGIEIPTLCHHPDLSDVGACRMCVVSVQGARGLQTACTTPATAGSVVETMSEDAVETRRFVLKVLLTDHPNDCMQCEANGDCQLQDLAYDYNVPWPEHSGARHAYPVDPDPNPFIVIDLNKCILCSRCIRACSEIQNRDVWSFASRGFKTKLVAGADQPLMDARCESCGQCVAYCPVGALSDRMSLGAGRANQVTKVRTTCSYCGVGCNFDLNVRNGKVVRVTSAADAPVNGMALCVKGRYGYDYVHHPERLTRPMVRAQWLDPAQLEARVAEGKWHVKAQDRSPNDGENSSGRKRRRQASLDMPSGRTTPWVEVDWDTALDVVAARIAEVKATSGPDAVSVLTSAKCTNEENYLVNKLTRQVIGTNNIDHCARL